MNQRQIQLKSELKVQVVPLRVVPAAPSSGLSLPEIVKLGSPQRGLDPEVNSFRRRNARYLGRGLAQLWPVHRLANIVGLPHFWSQLSLRVIRASGRQLDYGLVGVKVVTNAGVNFLADAFQDSASIENMRYHGIGTGSTTPAAGNTALVSESTTALNPNSTRDTGTRTEGSGANVYQTEGTLVADAAIVVREHGLFDRAATGGGVLWDRTVFGAVTLASGDSIEATYDLTCTAGG